jgi:copper resistance protein B
MGAMTPEEMAQEHGGGIYHMFRSETDFGGGTNGIVASWDIKGWVGGDDNKIWLKSEGEYANNTVQDTEVWALYSRNIATFWDAQAGIRQDVKPRATTYAVVGFNGLAPYFFETEAHLFISNNGDVSARLREENDFLITQRLVLQPYVEVNLFAQDVPKQEIGAGLADGKLGLQTRYQITRKVAPYIDVHYDRKFGRTASIARSNDEDAGEFVAAIGLRLMF